MSVISVCVVDDAEIMRFGIKTLIDAAEDVELTGEASNAADGLAKILRVRPDVAIVDGDLPDFRSADLVRELRERVPSVATLVLTNDRDDNAVVDAILAGAAGYALKNIGGNALLGGVRALAAGQSMLDPHAVTHLLNRMKGPVHATGELAALSPRERRILWQIGQGLTNRQIGEQLHIAEKTVKNNVTQMLSKLGLERRTQAAVLASRMSDQLGDKGA
ncbi:response regulator transcription factor [Nocardioides sp. InS609-2]|uniref:LuxR C-terminal-related transcriptional regulator n=1 Tax=Nocardioides sp. InS609-2 TaxID=2760705 RepID=UPI0020BFC3CB|nr:response regulator transcription factor [Nocardioides sp. InS609-2]